MCHMYFCLVGKSLSTLFPLRKQSVVFALPLFDSAVKGLYRASPNGLHAWETCKSLFYLHWQQLGKSK